MLKLQDYWRARSAQQKTALAVVFLLSFMGVMAFAWLANRPGMALLYSGLDSAQSGSVLEAIEKSGVRYQIRGDSIWVEEARRDALRMTLAGDGLPSATGAGYELLDGMSGFGTTSQMFDAAYWRAKEGELARTILAIPNVKAARVHLAVPGGRGYRRETQASASVTLTTNGTALSRAQAKALRFLVSSGVPGMSSDRVTVIDSERGVVGTTEELGSQDREVEMKRNVERILEPHVGIGNAIVELNLDIVTEAEILTEQHFDPEQRALISQESEETADQSSNAQQAGVTAASNLPEGQANNGEQSRSSRSETRQRSNFEVSKVTREVTRQPGAIRRQTVAVLVNGVAGTDATGAPTLVPRSEADLQAIRELVASAVGFDEARGDVITVKSLLFAGFADAGTEASKGGLLDRLELNSLVKLAMIGLFILLLVLLVLRPVLRARNATASAAMLDDTAALPPLAEQAPIESSDLPPLSMAVPEFDFEPMSSSASDPVARLKEMMKERKEESLKLLSGWIEKREDAL